MGSNDSAFRYHITWQSRGRLAWSPPPAQVEPAGGRTWVLHYLDPKGTAPGQAILLDRYLAALEPRLGTPRIERYPIGRPGGSGEPIVIFAYVFEGKRD